MRGAILNDRPFRTQRTVPGYPYLRAIQPKRSVVGKELAAEADASASKYQKLSLREAAQFDYGVKLTTRPSRWMVVSMDRAKRGVSRSARVKANKEKANG